MGKEDLVEATEDERLSAASRNLMITFPVKKDSLQPYYKFGAPKVMRRQGIASTIQTWDMRPVGSDHIHARVNEVIGLYI